MRARTGSRLYYTRDSAKKRDSLTNSLSLSLSLYVSISLCPNYLLLHSTAIDEDLPYASKSSESAGVHRLTSLYAFPLSSSLYKYIYIFIYLLLLLIIVLIPRDIPAAMSRVAADLDVSGRSHVRTYARNTPFVRHDRLKRNARKGCTVGSRSHRAPPPIREKRALLPPSLV